MLIIGIIRKYITQYLGEYNTYLLDEFNNFECLEKTFRNYSKFPKSA